MGAIYSTCSNATVAPRTSVGSEAAPERIGPGASATCSQRPRSVEIPVFAEGTRYRDSESGVRSVAATYPRQVPMMIAWDVGIEKEN